ncbi:MAG: class I SAM-dependent methyltransferase [Gemmatimonadaceae bacterium]|nr:class I SAM-dependent methyltransferase [Gemmatimonadaceae bacterium]
MRELATIGREAGRPLSVLDVGCWDGKATVAYRSTLQGPAAGVEVYPGPAAEARAKEIDVAEVDVEAGRMPWPDGQFDVIVANQVFEHLKNVWLPMGEIGRLLAPNGTLVFSVPNLASFHNRVMLAFGYQPSSIRTFGPHVRGFTYRQAREFVEYGGFLEVIRTRGVGFYPLPARLASVPANLWVGGCHTPILVARRNAAPETPPPWESLATSPMGEQTFYASAGTARVEPVRT